MGRHMRALTIKKIGKTMKYDLSICIPTYNRRECLQELLDSIVSQKDCPSPVQICIGDDASTDDTETFVRGYQEKYPHIVYYRFPENVGLEHNVLKAVSIARSGDYCWLMGNDDVVEQGAVKLITGLIKIHADLTMLNINGWQYDNQLKVRLNDRVKGSLKKEDTSKGPVI